VPTLPCQQHPPAPRSHTGKGDSGITEEPAAATALLLSGAAAAGAGAAASAAAAELGPGHSAEEPRWRKRSSYMSAVERVKRTVLWRASQAVARAHQGRGVPDVGSPLELPIEFRQLLEEVVQVRWGRGESIRHKGGLAPSHPPN
jgi:GNAT superfamily N-acetyltransferase